MNSKKLHKQPGANNLNTHKYKPHLLGAPPLLTAGSFRVRQRWCCTGEELDPPSMQTVNREAIKPTVNVSKPIPQQSPTSRQTQSFQITKFLRLARTESPHLQLAPPDPVCSEADLAGTGAVPVLARGLQHERPPTAGCSGSISPCWKALESCK